jgi:hypothetical protein
MLPAAEAVLRRLVQDGLVSKAHVANLLDAVANRTGHLVDCTYASLVRTARPGAAVRLCVNAAALQAAGPAGAPPGAVGALLRARLGRPGGRGL